MVGSTSVVCNFAIVQQVTIEAIDDKNVRFTTRGARPDGTADQNLRKTFTVPVSEIYARPIEGAPQAVDMVPGATGSLYLSRTGWQTVTDDGFRIYGYDYAIFKFPNCAGVSAPPLTRLTVIPTSIVVRGHLPDQTAFVEFELSGPDAQDAQEFAWNGVDYIDVRLTARGARRIGRPSQATTIQLWPTKIRIKGSPAIDQAVLGEVDVLDGELAAGMQRIAYERLGAPITLLLTQDGVNAFHVTPQAVEDAAGSAELLAPPIPASSGQGGGELANAATRRGTPV